MFSNATEMGWRFPAVYLWQNNQSSLPKPATTISRRRVDGRWQLADDVVVISLPERSDRQERISAMMERENIGFRFVEGVRVTLEEIEPFEVAEVGRQNFKMMAGFDKYLQGMAGCRRAHLRELEAARAMGLRSLLVIEDDMQLEEGWLDRLQAALAELPGGWMQLYFSSSDFGPSVQVSPHLRRLGASYQTTAILYSEAGIHAALNCLRRSRSDIDHWMGLHLHPYGNSYAIHPRIACQRGGVSDIMSFDRGTTA